jgi:hypothetical protein
VDVLKQLGDKLETHLALQEQQLTSLPRTEAAKQRATHIKLVRDFRRVESTFKNIVLETKRNKARLGEQQQQFKTTTLIHDEIKTLDEVEEDRIQGQLQLQQQVSHMRLVKSFVPT